MKVKCYGFSIIAILVSVLSGLGYSDVTESNIGDYVAADSISVADFIEGNFDRFVTEYNVYAQESAEENEGVANNSDLSATWQASYIENRYIITIEECGETYDGVFFDFDADNGYAVVGNDYKFLDFAATGNSPYDGISSESYYFSAVSGYYYLSNGEYVSVDNDNNADSNFIYENIASKHYDGQETNEKGCGKIISTDKYVKSKYGSGWKLGSNKSLSMKGYDQWDLSCYCQNKVKSTGVTRYSEGNCWAVSAFHVLQYMADNKWKKMPQSTSVTAYNPSVDEPNIYSRYFDSSGNNKTKLLSGTTYQFELARSAPMDFPTLYTEIRKHINSKYKQINDGGSIFATSEIIEYIAKKYGYRVNAQEHVFWGLYADQGTKKINSGYPLLWSTSNDTYSSHTMAVCGYKYYSKTSGWWIFKITRYKLFYELRDGHEADPRFYDMSGHIGFSAIISLEV